jgi:protein-disulfide isomerase
MRRFLLTLSIILAFAAPTMAAEFTKQQIEDIVKEYIKNNPKEIIDSVNAYGMQQQQEAEKNATNEVLKNMDWLTKNKNHAEAGNPKGDVTIVEFFDYNCGYCKQAFSDVMTLLDSDKNIRVVFIEIPILGANSSEVAAWALAADKQGKYFEYHSALMRHKGPFDEAVLSDYAKKSGLDVSKLKKDKADTSIITILEENTNKAASMGITGTPAFVVGDQVIRGYVGVEGLRSAVKTARAKK